MNQYMKTQNEQYEIVSVSITIKNDSGAVSFPVEISNPNYDQFLTETGLTDTEVHELEPDVWYDFPQKEEA